MTNDLTAILIVAAIIIAVVFIFIRITIMLRKRGGSLTTLVLGATDEFLIKDKSKAAETIVDLKAGKKMEEQATGEDKDPTAGE